MIGVYSQTYLSSRLPPCLLRNAKYIGDAADAFWENSILFCDATDVWPKTFPEIWNQDGSALFCAKDTMDVQTGESVRHQLEI